MTVVEIAIRNFRRLENVQLSLEESDTFLVGPNNSGKTAASTVFRMFFERNHFTLYDFNVGCIDKFNKFGDGEALAEKEFPAIELDIWLAIDPSIEFGRVFALLPGLSASFDKVGIRLRLGAVDLEKLKIEYDEMFPKVESEKRRKLSHFLTLPGVLARHFSTRYLALREDKEPQDLEPEEGRKLLRSLVRVDFIDAQRHIDDSEGGKHSRLSTAFADFYKYNLEKPDTNKEATKVIDENNRGLTAHYKKHFQPLLDTIAKLGVPAVHDRHLHLESTLSPQVALMGSTDLFYIDAVLEHYLPESYNGLGFKNLIYMTIQVSHFHTQWIKTEKTKPLCQLIFIEEPEVHLHAQVLQTFVANAWKILEETASLQGEPFSAPQLVISTHSPHVVDSIDFDKIRYFRRCPLEHQKAGTTKVLNASTIQNLAKFRPKVPGKAAKATTVANTDAGASTASEAERQETLEFLKKYIKITHCDLFFADAAILVEGTAEKLLMPQMIENSAPELKSKYLTVLEIGGAHAHRLAELLKFLGIPYLVIGDIDTVKKDDKRKACPADETGSRTANGALKYFLGKSERDDLAVLAESARIVENDMCYVSYQLPVKISWGDGEHDAHGRTFEEAFIYDNLKCFLDGSLKFTVDLAALTSVEEVRKQTYDEIKRHGFKKTDFALDMAAQAPVWRTPLYIESGLRWLDDKLKREIDKAAEPIAMPGTSP